MSIKEYQDMWDLEVIFAGGSSSPAFLAHLEETSQLIEDFHKGVEHWTISTNVQENITSFTELLNMFQMIVKKTRQAGAFASCLESQDTTDRNAKQLRGKVSQLSAKFQNALTGLDEKIISMDEKMWTEVLEDKSLAELAFVLTERRLRAKEKLSPEEERLINSLGVDGYHAWGQLYDLIVGQVKVPVCENGETKEISVGQAHNFFSHPDRALRQQVAQNWKQAWSKKTEFFTKTLNHISGFRLNVYKARGWDHVLKEALDYNRMKQETLDVMWEVISKNKAPFVKFLERKAKLLGVDQLSWYDLDAPVGQLNSKLSYQEGAEFIMEQFSLFGEEMTSFTEMAFMDRWIEASNRPNKGPGGFHTYFPESKQSRIFMTYSGTPSNVSTLAHELGHGFHTYAMRDLHILNRNYAMNVAETASTFAEMIVADAAVKKAKTKEERIALLEDKIQRSVAMFMNIHARFLFETRFYEERKNGQLSTERINELMTNALEEAYGGALKEYHPLFWASKLHFYITGVPFYNFPYTFGYLFSLGIYAQALQEGTGYEEKYIGLLKDSASMTVEDLAMKHLQVDLTKPDFWLQGVQLCMNDVEEFLALTEME